MKSCCLITLFVMLSGITELSAQCNLAINLLGASLECQSETGASDELILSIPYTGSDENFTITVIPQGGGVEPVVGGDDPATQSAGTVVISMLFENTTYAITLQGDNCNFGTLNYSIPDGICGALPVDLQWFSGREMDNRHVQLEWLTVAEWEADFFRVQRSTDGGRSFQAIGQLASVGSTEVQKHYQFIDPRPQDGENFYRLEQVDLDGSVTSYGPLLVHLETATAEWFVYPNPSAGLVSVSTSVDNFEFELWRQGQFLELFVGRNFDLSRYPDGVYWLYYRSNAGLISVRKLVLKKNS